MDTMEGIAEDGSELTDGLAREARIRSAYLQWCKDYDKEPDEARFPTFSSNFLAMEEYAGEAGKEMSLNAYADMTEEEYLAATAQAEPEPAPAPAPKPVAKVKTEAEKKAEEAAAAKKKAEEEAKAKKEAEGKLCSCSALNLLVHATRLTIIPCFAILKRIHSEQEGASIG